MTVIDCYSCNREAELDQLPPRELISYDEQWRVVHATGSALLGWLILTPRRHVMEMAELSDAESADLGIWQARLARALTEELRVSKVYVAEFGEAPGFHLHFHVVPRPRDLAVERRGPGIFGLLGRQDDDQVSADDRDQLALRLRTRLST
ncbi:HIT family protein [Phytoactinopolyspora halotolerans]|uniref:HIT family protein n=1 Tax=Phytoactinopolyspora halotolerans TaxID=1981512 RepID=A0A6L9SBZ6_9ACTN|nr:HIT family protein [Phytoactinopolyspora halotolerans]NEE01540.1 HIT family protein [Phytoactinopolyspora halotolerans]